MVSLLIFLSVPANSTDRSKAITTSDSWWHIPEINADKAWEVTNGTDIVIAVIDSGINFNHSDINHAQWINTDEIDGNGIDDDGNGYTDDRFGWDFVHLDGQSPDNTPGHEPGDPIHFHATFIAGIIAAKVDDFGIAGIAPKAKIMDLRILKADNYAGTTNAEFGKAIKYAVDNGADVISLSLQYYSNTSDLYDDIQYAYNHSVPMVSITGNSDMYYQSFPGGYDEVISVGATDIDLNKADYSNYGPWTELVAPVGDYYASLNEQMKSTYYDGTGYVYGVGTSFACPQVAATIALMRAIDYNLTIPEIRDILHDSATDLGAVGKDEMFGYGLLNVHKALTTTIARMITITNPVSPIVIISAFVTTRIIVQVVQLKRKKT
jgi:subtilisin family serine protease